MWLVGLLGMGCAGQSAPNPSPGKGPLAFQVDSMRAQGHRWADQGDHVRATRSFENAKQVAESIDGLRGLVDALIDLGAMATEDGFMGQSVTLHRQAVTLAEQLGQEDVLLRSITALAGSEQQVGHPEDAQRLYERAITMARAQGDRSAEAVVRNNMGLLQQASGDVQGAQRSFQEALEMNRALGNVQSEASNHANLALLAEARQDLDQAEREFGQALELDKIAENRAGIAGDLSNLSRIAAQQGFKDRGLGYADRAYRSYRAQGDIRRASKEIFRALELSRELGRLEEMRRYEEELKTLKDESIGR